MPVLTRKQKQKLKGNDLLATVSAVCLDTLPSEWRLDFFRDRCGFPNYRFP
ncbi:hypothetical protein MTR_2g027150 [Medicago truncatula]|uniref:Uncharacterized protein n=1 Tax=Medicago truncatula TaxID=3880 RepID=G7IQ23_MEDTR|nr:hypothetical protein MTR_2g027150 [Medicago truncatula]